MFNVSKEWEYKDLKVLDGEFTKKHPKYKNAECIFLAYDSREDLISVEFEDEKSAKLHPKELKLN
jgi:hypothetical protein